MWKENVRMAGNTILRCITAHWKKLCALAVCAVILSGAASGAHYFLFEIEGTVASVDGRKVAVTDILTTRVVDFAGSPINPARLQPGDEVEIKRNLITGTVFSLKFERRNYERMHDWR